MKKLRKQLRLLAALLVLTLTGCEAQDLLSTERADSGSEVTAAYTMTESQITDQAPPFQFLMFRSFPVNRMSF